VSAAGTAQDVRRLAAAAPGLGQLDECVSQCRACPRLVQWREQVAHDKRKAFADEPYWGRPLPGWGSTRPRVLVLGLAPAAHGGNRTGRVFTGDRSGDWLFASLHAVGLARLPISVRLGDGQRMVDTRVVAAVRCAPPQNKPTTAERDTCAPWLDAELALVRPWLRVVLALGSFAWGSALAALARSGVDLPRPLPRFGHGAQVTLGSLTLLGSYHPSQQNTNTGKLTRAMLDEVTGRAAALGRHDSTRPARMSVHRPGSGRPAPQEMGASLTPDRSNQSTRTSRTGRSRP
jgi:uracil-DNA glycosylase family 4